jgi:hypothetical protein
MWPRPEARVGVFLNERLALHFSGEVDPSSVTNESFRVAPVEGGEPARGRFEIDGEEVSFLPDLGLARDLSDGGLQLGTRYEVLVRGFPAPDGLRSVEGWPLAASGRFFIETAQLTEPRVQLFEDRSPARGAPLNLEQGPYGGEQSLRMTCAEPLDPSTLADGEFVLRARENPEESIPLDPRLVANSQEAGAVLELRPRRLLGPGLYRLLTPAGTSVRDFGGNPVWYSARPYGEPEIEVRDRGGERPELVETFLGDSLPSPLVIEEADGTAYWKDAGAVTVRFPLAAGDGSDGETRLAGTERRKDVHATRLVVAESAQVELLSVPGLVTLRSQGKMWIAGTLKRRAGPAETPIDGSFAPGETLSGWLAEALGGDRNWTVLVAGGDLVVKGDIDVDGPLLLAAGGRIRVEGRVHAQDDELWLVGDGGGGRLDPTASRAELILDPPYKNPLVEPLTFAVLSNYLPSRGGVARWVRAEWHGRARNGDFEVSFLPADLPQGRPLAEWGAVASPKDLLDCDRLRFLVVLTVHPPELTRRGLWEPPLLDDVRLVWESSR